MAGIVLTPDDHRTLQEMLSWWKDSKGNTTNRPRSKLEVGTQPETYIAKSPAGGIPAISHLTGTGPDDDPGNAVCDIYRVIGPVEDPELVNARFSKRVYNTDEVAVPANQYLPVWRDKFGTWLSHGPSGGAYIAKTPVGGIPPLGEWTGGVLTGTGEADDPGFATCDIYKIVDTPDAPELVSVSGVSKTVYNVSFNKIAGSQWIPIVRDAFGRWLAANPGEAEGYTGSESIVTHVECSGGTLTVTVSIFTWVNGLLVSVI